MYIYYLDYYWLIIGYYRLIAHQWANISFWNLENFIALKFTAHFWNIKQNHVRKKGRMGREICPYTSVKKCSYFDNGTKNDGIMISLSALFLPVRVCEGFISVIVTHLSSVHGELRTAHEKWLMAIMSVSPLSGNQVSSPLWNSNSPFVPLHRFSSNSYTVLPSRFLATFSQHDHSWHSLKAQAPVWEP